VDGRRYHAQDPRGHHIAPFDASRWPGGATAVHTCRLCPRTSKHDKPTPYRAQLLLNCLHYRFAFRRCCTHWAFPPRTAVGLNNVHAQLGENWCVTPVSLADRFPSKTSPIFHYYHHPCRRSHTGNTTPLPPTCTGYKTHAHHAGVFYRPELSPTYSTYMQRAGGATAAAERQIVFAGRERALVGCDSGGMTR